MVFSGVVCGCWFVVVCGLSCDEGTADADAVLEILRFFNAISSALSSASLLSLVLRTMSPQQTLNLAAQKREKI